MSKSRKRKSGASAAVFLASLIGALILLNLISVKRFVRADLTEDGLYTLSDASKRIVKELSHPMVVKAYFSPDLQAPFHTFEQRVRDMLEEYRAYSGGNLTYEVKNPDDTEEDKDEAAGFGINPVQITHRGATRAEVRKVYMGVAFVHQDKQEVLGRLKPGQNLEYEFTQAIKRVTSDEGKKTLGFLGGHGELIDMDGVERAFGQIFGELYDVKKVNVDDGKPVPEEVDALLVINPQSMVPERTKYEIDQFLMRGGAVGFFLAAHAQDRRFPIGRSQPVITGLEGLLSSYGVQMRRDIILDRVNNTQMLLPTPQGLVIANNPLAFVTRDVNKEHIITKGLGGLNLPFSSPLSATDELKNQEGAQVDVLVRTEPSATARATLTDTNPDELFKNTTGEINGPFDVALAVVAEFKSSYAGKDIPQPASQPAGAAAERERVEASPAGGDMSRLFVMGNGEFLVHQGRLQRSSVIFLQNLVDWLVADHDLISIRSKGGPRMLETVEPGKRTMLTYANAVGVPMLFCLFGFLRWTMRRKRKVDLWEDA